MHVLHGHPSSTDMDVDVHFQFSNSDTAHPSKGFVQHSSTPPPPFGTHPVWNSRHGFLTVGALSHPLCRGVNWRCAPLRSAPDRIKDGIKVSANNTSQ
ncbi:hypothetical protein TNCV_5013061 [Trichonephila clavipes]|nr:hypothetical protein TNCV_5013061 [Trichonephila clavipes]